MVWQVTAPARVDHEAAAALAGADQRVALKDVRTGTAIVQLVGVQSDRLWFLPAHRVNNPRPPHSTPVEKR